MDMARKKKGNSIVGSLPKGLGSGLGFGKSSVKKGTKRIFGRPKFGNFKNLGL